MPWPLSQDYNEAIQNPQTCFADPELRGGHVVVNALGIPLPRSGNFADVYEFHGASGAKWAIKCFTRQIPGLRQRYREISSYLNDLSKRIKLSFLVDFTFLDQGLRIRGDWYPILKMQWVEGYTLNEFLKSHLDNRQTLEILCQRWVQVAKLLRQANLGHCDLQHGNVLLVPNVKTGALSITLVDYDGMCVPSLTLLKSIELGHPAYQHPQRVREGIYSLEVDRFCNLVIYTALRSLVVGSRPLWERYDNGDNLLFCQEDFQKPSSSRLLQELLHSDDPEARRLAARVAWAAQQPLARTPLLTDLVPDQHQALVSAHATPLLAKAPTPNFTTLYARTEPAHRPHLTTPTETTSSALLGQEYEFHRKPRWIPWVAVGCTLGLVAIVAGLMVIASTDSTKRSSIKPLDASTNRREDAVSARPQLTDTIDAGTIFLEIEPTGAAVLVDGKPVHWTLQNGFHASTGKHALTVTKAGFKAHVQWLQAEAGKAQKINIQLKPVPWPADATKIGENYYKVYWEPLSWSDAGQQCHLMGGQLAVVDTEQKQTDLAKLKGEGKVVWVGGYLATDGKWYWLDGNEIDPKRVTGQGPGRICVAYCVGSPLNCRPDDGYERGYAVEKVQGFLCEWKPLDDLEAEQKPTMPVRTEGERKKPRFVPLDIKEVATVSSSRIFNQESLHFPKWGNQTHHDVPFTVVDPAGGKTKNTICLYSGLGAISAKMPRTVRLPCDLGAKVIHFLGAAGWGVPWNKKGTVSMVVQLVYADGAKEAHSLINGVHLTDWAKGPDVPESKTIGVLQVRYFSIVPNRQGESIRTIEFQKGTDQTSPFVIAVTIETPAGTE